MVKNLKVIRKKNPKSAAWQKRKLSVRKKIRGDESRPRITVFRSAKHIYAQAIDDERSVTLAQASSVESSLRTSLTDLAKTDAATKVGALIAERLLAQGVKSVVFDRNGYRYHGRVAALATGARGAGLEF